MTSLELKNERAKLISAAKLIIDSADAEARDLTPDEEAKFQELTGSAEKIAAEVAKEEKRELIKDVEAELSKSTRKASPVRPSDPRQENKNHRAALRAWFLSGTNVPLGHDLLRSAEDCGININSRSLTLRVPSRTERAMVVGTPAAGGLTVGPEFSDQLYENLKLWGGALEAVQVIQTSTGAPLPYVVATDNNIGEIVPEMGAVTEQDPVFQTLTISSFKYSSKSVKLSLELAQDSSFDMESYLSKILAERIGKILNQHLTNGTGTGQPQGLTVGASVGVTGPVSFDSLVELCASVDNAYGKNGKFMFHPSVLSTLSKVKDSTGSPLWIPDFRSGQPGKILGYDYLLNTDMPAPTAGNEAILFGDFKSAYVCREVMSIELFKISELYLLNGAIGFVAFARYDGRTVNSDAVKSLTVA